MKRISDEELVRTLREELDRSVDAIEPAHAARLRRARLQALSRGTRKGWYGYFPYWLTPARVSLGAVALLAVSLFAAAPSRHTAGLNPDDIEVIASGEQVEMIQDLDFYRWMATTASQRRGSR